VEIKYQLDATDEFLLQILMATTSKATTISIFTAPNTTGSNHLYNTLELLMMGIMVPEIC
jgi:hypothetical protein